MSTRLRAECHRCDGRHGGLFLHVRCCKGLYCGKCRARKGDVCPRCRSTAAPLRMDKSFPKPLLKPYMGKGRISKENWRPELTSTTEEHINSYAKAMAAEHAQMERVAKRLEREIAKRRKAKEQKEQWAKIKAAAKAIAAKRDETAKKLQESLRKEEKMKRQMEKAKQWLSSHKAEVIEYQRAKRAEKKERERRAQREEKQRRRREREEAGPREELQERHRHHDFQEMACQKCSAIRASPPRVVAGGSEAAEGVMDRLIRQRKERRRQHRDH